MQKQVQYIIKGMNRDMSISKYPSDHSYENRNIRITQREEDTLLSITNEKGPSEVVIKIGGVATALTGTIVGHCVIREYIVLFTTQMTGMASQWEIITNTVYRIEASTGNTVILVQHNDNRYIDGTHKFEKNNLLFGKSVQAFGVYESDDVIKVYWTDDNNQNRFMNIVNPKYGFTGPNDRYKANDTNFVPLLDYAEGLNPTQVTVERIDSSNGMFAPGAIQYMCTYFNMYGQESAFFFYSDLYYTSHADRGGNEEETVSNAFKIEIQYPETQFEYVRIYSILRTSLNATPQCRIVADVSIANLTGNTITVIDTGTIGESFDVNALLFMCGDIFSSKTMAIKDDTLFNGNLKLLVPAMPKNLKNFFRDAFLGTNANVTSRISVIYSSTKEYSSGETGGDYPYNIHLNKSQSQITTFKYLETYRFGVQFLHKTGKWSDVVFVGDVKNTVKPETAYNTYTIPGDSVATRLVKADLLMQLDSDADEYLQWLSSNGFVKARAVVVYPRLCDRSILAQGIVCPTVYNVEDRKYNRPYAYSSWYARPNAGDQDLNLTLGDPRGAYNEFRHNKQIPDQKSINAELQCITDTNQSPIVADNADVTDYIQKHRENFFIDKSIVTFHSPELEMSDDLDVVDMTNVKFRIVGIAPLTGFSSDLYVSVSTIGNLTWNAWFRESKAKKRNSAAEDADAVGKVGIGPGFYDEKIGTTNLSPDGWRCRMGNINWIDEETNYIDTVDHLDRSTNSHDAPKWFGFFVYPWHRSTSLNNTTSPDENGWESALLQNKIITNARYSFNSFYFPDLYTWEPDNDVSGIKLANIEPQEAESEVSLIKIPAQMPGLKDLNYYGSVDKIVSVSNSNTTDYSLHKGVGYPFIIAASSRYTDYCQDGKCLYQSSTRDTNHGYMPRAASFHELFRGLYDQRATLDPYYNTCKTNHNEGTLLEYLPERWIEQAYNSGSDEDNYTFKDYVQKDGDHLRETYWNISTFDPVRLRYKSTKHAVMAFKYSEVRSGNTIIGYNQIILPRINNESNEGADDFSSKKYFWEEGNLGVVGVSQYQISLAESGLPNNSKFGYMFLGELYRDTVQNRFGGDTEEALEKNTWLPAGKEVNLQKDPNNRITLPADRGDTYYQRYDCIKTYPFTRDEKNSLIENVSFMCETHINIDGRYDKNRGNATKFTITPANFNIMNPVYNQVNNFFNYQFYNSSRFYPDHFNQIAWSQTKSAMNEIDTWTKLNLSSVMDMDGDKGEIVALVNFGNEIWCFQERGISKILFNNRVQIPVSDGVPIEITNGMKVQGKIYLTEKAGCQNKFAMAVTTHGVYFIDGYNSDICVFDGKSIQSLSDAKGFKQWISAQDGITEWKRSTYATKVDGFRIEYDTEHKDVYFINDDHCLVFSEILGEFTSFMDYNKVRGMGNVKDEFYSLTDFDGEIKVWKMFGGDYNVFFKPDDEEDWAPYYKPFYVQYNVNPDPTMDKTFDNVEFRSDSWFGDVLLTALDSAGGTKTFDTLEAENEYQYGALSLNFAHAQYSQDSTLKRKFRVWRTIMPREVGTRNRIRNTWCKVKLAWNNPNRYKTVLHDVIIRYFE